MSNPEDKNAALADKLAATLTIRKNQGMVWRNGGWVTPRLTDDEVEAVIAALRSAPSERANATRYGDPFCDPANRFLMHKHFKSLCPTAGEKEYIALEITMNTIFSDWRTEPQIRALASSAAPSEGEK
jgi:hypothetical protein